MLLEREHQCGDSSSFFNKLRDMKFDPRDSLVSFDVVSMYTNIPIKETIDVIFRLTDLDTTKLVKISLTSTYFCFEGELYEQTCGVAMGSPLSPMISNLLMEDFESKALSSAIFRPKIWKIFVDDTSTIWLHGPDKLDLFLHHLSNHSNSIKFAMEQEVDGFLPFLDVLISRKVDGSFSH